MRSKFGTSLALAAVLLTGTAAAAINTQALNSPATSTFGTAATTLLPVDQAVSVTPVPVQVSPVTPVQSSTASAPQVASTPAPQQSASAGPTVANTGTNQTATTLTAPPTSPSVTYGNPNPSKGGDGDDDDEGQDNDGDDD